MVLYLTIDYRVRRTFLDGIFSYSCHLPMLHVGMECGLSNNPLLAMKFLEEARLLAPRDPFIRHEMGVVKFSEKK